MNNLLVLWLVLCLMTTPGWATLRGEVHAGNAAYKKGAMNEAYGRYSQALSRDPANGYGNNNQGLVQYRRQLYKDSTALLSTALKDPRLSDGEKSQVAYNMANSLYKEGKSDQALQAYKQALDLDPKNEEARYNLSVLRMQKKNKQAQQQQNEKNKSGKGDKNPDRRNPSKPDQQQNDNEKQKPNQPRDNSDMSKDEAKSILDKVARDEARNPVRPQGEMKGDQHVDKDW